MIRIVVIFGTTAWFLLSIAWVLLVAVFIFAFAAVQVIAVTLLLPFIGLRAANDLAQEWGRLNAWLTRKLCSIAGDPPCP